MKNSMYLSHTLIAVLCAALLALPACGQKEQKQKEPPTQTTFTKKARLHYIPNGVFIWPPRLCCYIIETIDNEILTVKNTMDVHKRFRWKYKGTRTVRVHYQITNQKPEIFLCSDCKGFLKKNSKEKYVYLLSVSVIYVKSIKEII